MLKTTKFSIFFEIWSKMWNLVKDVNLGKICEVWSTLWNLVKIVKFVQNWPDCENWSKLWDFVKIVKSGQNCEIWLNCEIWSKLRNLVKTCYGLVKILKLNSRPMVCLVQILKLNQNSEWVSESVSQRSRYRAARAAKKRGKLSELNSKNDGHINLSPAVTV